MQVSCTLAVFAYVKEQFAIEFRKPSWIAGSVYFTSLRDWFRKLTPQSQPIKIIKNKANTSPNLTAYFFPRLQ